jgi:hypothetical protein
MSLSIKYENQIIQFSVEYRRRKTLEIQILPPDKVLVICPKGLSENRVKEVVRLKAKWIISKIKELRDIEFRPIDSELKGGESFMYLGNNYTLQINIKKNLKKPKVDLTEGKIHITAPVKDDKLIRDALKGWYRKKADELIKNRVEYYKPIIDREPKLVKVKEQKKRWGSCTSEGNIYFNWRIIMAPIDVIDYVVVHELCHLIHMNHSKYFWKLVESILPDYKERKSWLKKYGIGLNI